MTPLALSLLALCAIALLLRARRRRLESEEREAPKRLTEALDRLKVGNSERVPALLAAAFYEPSDGRCSDRMLEIHQAILRLALDELRLTDADRRAVEAYRARLDRSASAGSPAAAFDRQLYRPVRKALDRLGGRLEPDPEEKARLEFGRRVLKRVHAAGAREATFDADEFCVKLPDGAFLHLGCGFGPWRAAGSDAERCGAEDHMVQVLLRPERVPQTYEEARGRLLPRLRSHAGREANRLFLELKGSVVEPPPCMPVGGDLVAELMWDGERTVSQVGQETLVQWGVTFEDAMAEALRNLADKKDLVVASLGGSSEDERKLFMSTTEDFHNSARLLVMDVLRPLPLPREIAAIAPVEGHFYLADPGDLTGMMFMGMSALRSLEEDGRPLSTDLLRLEGDRWVPWELPADHPAAGPFRKLRVLGDKQRYDRQGTLLKELHQDLFVATQMVYEKRDKELFTVCTWSDGVPALLPKAEKVAFMGFRADGESVPLGEAPWDRVTEVLGDLMTPRGMVPERFEVKAFPTREQTAGLGAARRLTGARAGSRVDGDVAERAPQGQRPGSHAPPLAPGGRGEGRRRDRAHQGREALRQARAHGGQAPPA